MRKHCLRAAALLLPLAMGLVWAGMAAAASEPSTSDLVAAAPDESAYPGADAVVLYESIRYDLQPDGRMTRRVRRVTKLFDEWAVNHLGDVRIQWDGARQEAAVPVCRTFMRDGTEVVTPPRGLNEVTPDGVADCAGHLDVREMVISHVGLERGAVTELVYEIRDLEPAPLGASGLIWLRDGVPALSREISITSPASLRLDCASLNGAPDMTSTYKVPLALDPPSRHAPGDTTHYLGLSLRDVPALPAEGGYEAAEQVPAIAFSATPTWQELGEKLAEESFLAAPPAAELTAWLLAEMEPGEATAGPDAETPTALRLVEKVAELTGDRLRPARPADPWLRAPRPPAEVLGSGCGTAWERIALADALLRAAGLVPELVLPAASAASFDSVPGPELLGPPWLRVEAAGRTRWLSADSSHPEVAPAELAGLPLLVLSDEGEDEIAVHVEPAPAPPEASSILSARLRPAADGEDENAWDLELDYAAAGACCPAGGSEGPDAEKLARQMARGLLDEPEVASSNLLEKSPDRLHLRATVRGKLAGTMDGLAVLPLPAGPRGAMELLPAGVKLTDPERTLGLRLRQPVVEELDLVVELPQGATADPLPAAADLALDGDLAGARFRQQATAEPGRLHVTRSLRLPAGEVPAAAWPQLRRLLTAASRPDGCGLGVRLP